MDRNILEFCILNIAATPHPKGVYVDLLERAVRHNVNFWGDTWATISKPTEVESGFFQGRIVTWSEINRNEPGINKDDLSEIPFDDLDIAIPEHIGLNGKVFLYTLRERDHKLFIETKNEFGKSLSPRRVRSIFSRLLSADVQGDHMPFVEVTVVPDEDALSKILGIDKLKYLHVHIVRPNPDDIEEDAAEILREMEEQNVKTKDVTLTVAPRTDGIDPNGRTETEARVATINGYVEGRGTDSDGQTVKRSTKEYPRVIRENVGEFGSVLQTALRVAKSSVVGERGS